MAGTWGYHYDPLESELMEPALVGGLGRGFCQCCHNVLLGAMHLENLYVMHEQQYPQNVRSGWPGRSNQVSACIPLTHLHT